ncbi:hypothetical protein EGW08_021833 [Elysia chlorotica]|uniref:Uncharacterized protein n=1 Tax=Elysia chlorotica TaxID=188477 RepID=A0A3S1AWX2_ELYCH|nr:hypothetical protein EGW08_021833 [Elysia chlorotica]
MVKQGGRNGAKDTAHAFNGNSHDLMYRTPKEFYGNTTYMQRQAKGVLDRQGNLRLVAGVGPKLLSYPIDGLGNVRLRYPVFPVHAEGGTLGMEIEALKDSLMKMSSYAYLYEDQPMASGASTGPLNVDVDFRVKDTNTNPPGLHGHDFTLTAGEYQALRNGTELQVTTSYNLGHNHELAIYYSPGNQRYVIRTCDGLARCWDNHSTLLDMVPA